MQGSENSYKHTNGLALRLACLEYINDIINDNYDIDRLIHKSKEFLEIVKSINLQSFKRMVDNPEVDAFIAKGYQKDFKNESVEIKTILSAIYNRIREHGKDANLYIADIEGYVTESKYKPEGRSNAAIFDRFNKQRLEHHYRIEFNQLDSISYFSIKDLKPIESIFGKFEPGNLFETAAKADQIKIVTSKDVEK